MAVNIGAYVSLVNWRIMLMSVLSQFSVWDIKEPLRRTSTLAVTTLAVTTISASIEKAAWCKCSQKDVTSGSKRPYKIITS